MLGFLGEKENSLKTDDYGRDLSSVQTLLTKQVSWSRVVDRLKRTRTVLPGRRTVAGVCRWERP